MNQAALMSVIIGLVAIIASPVDAAHYPDTPMPDRPSCHHTHCEDVWNGERRVRRCHWRCPSQEYKVIPEQRLPRHVPMPARDLRPVRTASRADALDPRLLLLGAAGLLIVLLAAALTSKSSAGSDTERTAALIKKLEHAAREADAHIAAFLARERNRERDHG